MEKTKIMFNKPIYIGMSIPDSYKLCVCHFYCNVLKNQRNDKVKLLHTDSDCVNVEMRTEDIDDDDVKRKINGF
jgi:hypothetical protein